jgi:NitT/TauT family transport system substrate-binding protein
MVKTGHVRLLTTIGVTLVVAACGTSAGTPTPAATAAPTTASTAAPSESSAGSEEPSGSPAAVVLPAAEQTKIRWGQSGTPTSGALPFVAAIGAGLDKKYGLDIEFTPFNGGAPAAQAMLAGQSDVGDNSGGPVIASLATDTPLVMTYVTRSNLTDNLYGSANVKSADDLKGKSIAISSFGSQSHAGALLALKSLGLTDKDVTITQVGNDSARLAALQAGSVAASMNDAEKEQQLKDAGFNVLAKLTEVEGLGGVPTSTLTTTRTYADQNPNTVLLLTAMLLEGSVLMRKDPDMTAQSLSKLAEIPIEDAGRQVDEVLAGPWQPADGKCDPEVLEFTKSVLLAANPDLATIDPQPACTNEFLDKLNELGFQHSIGVPGY